MIENNFKLILQNKRQQLKEDLIITDSLIKPLFVEMAYNESEYQEQIVRLQRELDRVTYNG